MSPFDLTQTAYLRRCLGMTQISFAQTLNVNQSTVSRWEKGKSCPTTEHLSIMFDMAKEKGIRVHFFK
jgi:DNA-binding transcriptional regulator YiaG